MADEKGPSVMPLFKQVDHHLIVSVRTIDPIGSYFLPDHFSDPVDHAVMKASRPKKIMAYLNTIAHFCIDLNCCREHHFKITYIRNNNGVDLSTGE